ncbi:hypothetical protein BDM02DRAFT_1696348 [Thelephora ganbajun]|uniref:Uncharacterized protein n=1 Tax=Thelephora ganbajun TaxID=370292 RepID=A0ACB6ZJX6_THEGA|nr:hypothetical protein BDM02DRAFT_1696348 [Thelephora ganbajun]
MPTFGPPFHTADTYGIFQQLHVTTKRRSFPQPLCLTNGAENLSQWMCGYAVTICPHWSVSSDPLLLRMFPPPTCLHSFLLSLVLLAGICALFGYIDTPHWVVGIRSFFSCCITCAPFDQLCRSGSLKKPQQRTDGLTTSCIYTKDMWT